jgi:hypothetical protein
VRDISILILKCLYSMYNFLSFSQEISSWMEAMSGIQIQSGTSLFFSFQVCFLLFEGKNIFSFLFSYVLRCSPLFCIVAFCTVLYCAVLYCLNLSQYNHTSLKCLKQPMLECVNTPCKIPINIFNIRKSYSIKINIPKNKTYIITENI